MTLELKSVIFDYGGVLCLLPTDAQIQELAGKCGLPEAEFLKLFWEYRIPYDRGDMDSHDYWRSIGKAAGKEYSVSQVAEFAKLDNRFWLKLDEPMLEWNEAIREAGLKTAILSNMPEPLGAHLYAETTLFDRFDVVTLSYEVRSAKPEAKIYRRCLAGLELKAGEVLFFDDKAHNVHAAQACGLHAKQWTTRKAFAGQEAKYGLPPVPKA